MRAVIERDLADESYRSEFARGPVLSIAGALAVVLVVVSGLGEYWFDELYLIAAGEQLQWGYADQPWLVPWLAAALDAIAPGSMIVLRLPATLAAAGGVVITALISVEFGGGRRAQVLAGGAYATSIWIVVSAHWLVPYSLDPFWWLVITWLLVRWVRTREQGAADDRLLLWAGAVTALSLQTKLLVPLLWISIGIGLLIAGPRDLLRRPLLWIGAGISTVATLPTLYWQATHGWPQWEFTRVVGAEARRDDVLTGLPAVVGLVGTVFVGYALWRLFRASELRAYRFIGWSFLVLVALVIVLDGRHYYPAGMVGLLFAVAAVELERRALVRWWKWVAWPAYVLSAGVALAALLAVALIGGITGKATAEPVARAYHALPAEQRERTAIVAEIYPAAATFDHYGEELGIPRVRSPHRGYWFFGAPSESVDTVLYAEAGEVDRVRPYFDKSRQLGDSGSDFDLWLLEGPRESWSELWPKMQTGLTEN